MSRSSPIVKLTRLRRVQILDLDAIIARGMGTDSMGNRQLADRICLRLNPFVV